MNMNYVYVIAAIVLFLIFVIMTPVLKRMYYKKMMKDLDEKNFEAFEKHLDSFWAKMSFSAFERESMRLTMYKLKNEMRKADEQIQFMENMRLRRKQKAQLGEEGFYTYLEQGKIKKARHMVDMVKENGSEKQAKNLEIQYSILLKKESKYIDEVKEYREKLKDASGNIPENLKMHAGTFEYLIGLQYYYIQDKKNTKQWLSQALEHLKGTPYEPDIVKMLNA